MSIQCPECGRKVRLLTDGRLRRHPRKGDPYGPECIRSHTPYAKDEERDKAAATDSWKKLHVGGVWVGVAVSLLFSALTFYQGFSNAALSRELEASDALNEVGQVLRKTTESAMVPINDAEIDLEIACHVLEEKVIKLDPDNARSQAYLGLCREEKGQLDEAVAAYHKAIKRDPNDAWSHWRLGSILRDLGRFEEAAIAYRRAIKIHPKFAQAHASWGDLHRDTSHFEKAAAAYREALEIDPGLSERFGPKLAEVQIELVNFHRGSGDFEKAAAAYREALEIDPEFSEKIGLKPAEVQVELGHHFEARHRLKEAEAAFCEAIMLDSEHAEAHAALGDVLWRLGRSVAAEYAYNTAISINPRHARSFYDKLDGKLRRLDRDLHDLHTIREVGVTEYSREILASSLRKDREKLVAKMTDLQLPQLQREPSIRRRGGVRVPPSSIRWEKVSEAGVESFPVNIFDLMRNDETEEDLSGLGPKPSEDRSDPAKTASFLGHKDGGAIQFLGSRGVPPLHWVKSSCFRLVFDRLSEDRSDPTKTASLLGHKDGGAIQFLRSRGVPPLPWVESSCFDSSRLVLDRLLCIERSRTLAWLGRQILDTQVTGQDSSYWPKVGLIKELGGTNREGIQGRPGRLPRTLSGLHSEGQVQSEARH